MKPISKMNRKEKAELVAEAKAEIPRMLATVSVLHKRMLRINTKESLNYAEAIERQAAVLQRILETNHEKVGR